MATYRFTKVGTYKRKRSGGTISICTQGAVLRAPDGEYDGQDGVERMDVPVAEAQIPSVPAPARKRKSTNKGKPCKDCP